MANEAFKEVSKQAAQAEAMSDRANEKSAPRNKGRDHNIPTPKVLEQWFEIRFHQRLTPGGTKSDYKVTRVTRSNDGKKASVWIGKLTDPACYRWLDLEIKRGIEAREVNDLGEVSGTVSRQRLEHLHNKARGKKEAA